MNKWWEDVDPKWRVMKYSESGKRFYGRKCGLFYISVEPIQRRGIWMIFLSSMCGSLSLVHKEMFFGTLLEAKRCAESMARTALRNIVGRITNG